MLVNIEDEEIDNLVRTQVLTDYLWLKNHSIDEVIYSDDETEESLNRYKVQKAFETVLTQFYGYNPSDIK